MDFKGLSIIGERINPGFKSSLALLENEDIQGIRRLAVEQVQKGADILNINTGVKGISNLAFVERVVRNVQEVAPVPLSFDAPNFELPDLCLSIYDKDRAGGRRPVINSISELRWEMTDLLKKCPSKVILMASERNENGEKVANKNAKEVYETAGRMTERLLSGPYGLTKDDLYIDVSVGPIAADTEGLTRMAVDAIRMIGSSKEMKGVHMSVGLSNISIMVPAKALDGSPLKLLLESAFLTRTVPYGLDTIIGTAGREYKILPDDNFIMQGFDEALGLDDIDAIMRIQALYQAA